MKKHFSPKIIFSLLAILFLVSACSVNTEAPASSPTPIPTVATLLAPIEGVVIEEVSHDYDNADMAADNLSQEIDDSKLVEEVIVGDEWPSLSSLLAYHYGDNQSQGNAYLRVVYVETAGDCYVLRDSNAWAMAATYVFPELNNLQEGDIIRIYKKDTVFPPSCSKLEWTSSSSDIDELSQHWFYYTGTFETFQERYRFQNGQADFQVLVGDDEWAWNSSLP